MILNLHWKSQSQDSREGSFIPSTFDPYNDLGLCHNYRHVSGRKISLHKEFF